MVSPNQVGARVPLIQPNQDPPAQCSASAGSSDIAGEGPRAFSARLATYRNPSNARSIVEIAVTAAPLVLVWTLMWIALEMGIFPLYVLLAVPAAGLLVRLFMIQHDCGHGSFFRGRSANDWVGRVLGVFTLTPYDQWRAEHAAHHAGSGNLDRRGIGDIDTLTVSEFEQLSWRKRWRYRLYRHPAVMFGLGPSYFFLLRNRIPFTRRGAGRLAWVSTMGTNAALAALIALFIWLLGLKSFLLLHLPVATLAASIGVWLFYVQHQFEETFWARTKAWSVHEAALFGSSYYVLPGVLRWFTANIGVHHVHHLASRIPFYRLPLVLREHPELETIGRLTLMESLRCVPLVLWDEAEKRLISFRELRRRAGARGAEGQPGRPASLARGFEDGLEHSGSR